MIINQNLALVASMQFGIGSAYDCHVYALRAEGGIVLIDSGSGLAHDSLLYQTRIAFPNQQIRAVILTHAHPDHCCGAAAIHRATGCRVFAPDVSLSAIRQGDELAILLEQAKQQGTYPDDMRMSLCPSAEAYSDEVEFSAAGQVFRPIRVRGHSDDSHCLVTEVQGQQLMFAGDVLFYGAVLGVINASDSGMIGYYYDLKKLTGLAIDALLPGHGLFTLKNGQKHIDVALEQVNRGFLPRQVGQGDLIF